MRIKTHTLRTIPMSYSKIAAGVAVEIEEGFYELDVNELITGGRSGFSAYEVDGDSGLDYIPHGCIIFVDSGAMPREGQPVGVLINERVCVKKFSHSRRGLYLISVNDKYKPVEIKSQDAFRILGVVRSHLTVL